jgi:putative ABC transport system substrate-binding protein
MVSRRQILMALGAGGILAPLTLVAQPSRVYRIGFLGNSTAALEANLIGPFRDGLREHGYVEGRNVVIDFRWAEGNYSRFPKLIAELVSQKPDVIVTAGTPAALAVQKGAPSIPLVMVAVGDPVGSGLVASLALPGGNSTGLTSIAPDLEGKRLELLMEIVPNLKHIAVLLNPANRFHVTAEAELREAARDVDVRVDAVGVATAAELDRAFDAIVRVHPDAFIMLADRVFLHNRARIVDFARKRRLPAVYAYRELVDAGGLMSFGPDYGEMHHRAANYVDRILRGAKPADLPIEQPKSFNLIVNLKAAREIGVGIPRGVVLRASEVLE